MVHVCSFPCGFRVNYLKTPWFVWSLVEEKGESLEGSLRKMLKGVCFVLVWESYVVVYSGWTKGVADTMDGHPNIRIGRRKK